MDFCLCLSVWALAAVFLRVYYIHLIYQGEQTWGKLPCAQIAERLVKTREDKSKESLPCAQSLWFLRKTVENKSKKSLSCTQLPWILINTRENKSEEILSYAQSPRIQSTPSRFTWSTPVFGPVEAYNPENLPPSANSEGGRFLLQVCSWWQAPMVDK